MKTRLYLRLAIATVILVSFCDACQQIPDVEEFMEDIIFENPVDEPVHYDKLISEVGIAIPFSVTEIGTMIYQFTYYDDQRLKTIDLNAHYADGEEYKGHAEYSYSSEGVLMYTSGMDLYMGQMNGITKFDFDADGMLKNYTCSGIEHIPDFSFGRTNSYYFNDGFLSSVFSRQSGAENQEFTREYDWVDGNILQETTTGSDGESFEISYNYTGYIDKSNLDLLKLAYYLNYYKGLYFTADKVTFNDLSSKYLPAEQIQFAGEETYTFEYEFDADQYVKKIYIYIEGELFQIMNINYTDEEPSDFPQDSSLNISEALGMPDGTDVTISGTVVAVTQRGFLLGDGTEMLYVYGGPEWNLCVEKADRVKVSGKMSTYWNNRELILTKVDVIGKVAISETSPYHIDALNIRSFAQSDSKPLMVQVEGVLTSGEYDYVIQVGDSDIILALEFPMLDLSRYLGKTINMTGYYLWTSTTEAGNLVMEVILDDFTVLDTPYPSGKTANCYIVSSPGTYSFDTVKGNSSESVGNVVSAEVLWESFGTDVVPSVGDLISSVSYSGGKITYRVPYPFREGNAVIAAKDEYGTILWSWHIWLTDQPIEQVYYNDAGTMMDRNLGATSATPGDVGALGLLYQWGRKDPFLGSSSVYSSVEAESTGKWPSPISTSSSSGNVDYSVRNPMTFIYSNSPDEFDWHYSYRNNELWSSSKTIYDPCPLGWRIPDGGDNGIWSKACGYLSYFIPEMNDIYNGGVNLSGYFGDDQIICYPAPGWRYGNDGILRDVRTDGLYWSVATEDYYANVMYVAIYNARIDSSTIMQRGDALSVRCQKE